MAWIALQDTVWTHHKTAKLSSSLNISLVCAVGHLLSLWHFAMSQRPEDGDLTDWGESGIESAARWSGKSGAFIEAARASKLLDGGKIHGWEKHALHYAVTLERRERKLEQVRERVKRFRERKKPPVTHCNAPVTQSNAATLQDIPYKTDTTNHTDGRKRPNFTPPSLEEVRTYCQERGKGVDAERWISHYESNGWRVGRNPMKDWRAAVRTWEHSNFIAPVQKSKPARSLF